MISQLGLILPKDEIKLFLPQNILLQDACDKKAHWFHLMTPQKIVLSYPNLVEQWPLPKKKITAILI